MAKQKVALRYVMSIAAQKWGTRLGNHESGAKAVEIPIAGIDRAQGDDVRATHT